MSSAIDKGERSLAVNGRRVHLLDVGFGPVLFLLHGIGSNAFSWMPVLPMFSRHYRVIAWDMPGYGGSDPFETERPHASRYADAVASILDEARVSKAIIIGHSLGAIIAVEFAKRHAHRLAGLVLTAPALGSGIAPGSALPDGVATRIRELTALGASEFAHTRAAKLCAPNASSVAIDAVESAMCLVKLPGYAQACGLLAEADLPSALATLHSPGLVVAGGQDGVVPTAKARSAASVWSGARYIEISHVGHAAYVEDPDAYAAPILSYLRETV